MSILHGQDMALSLGMNTIPLMIFAMTLIIRATMQNGNTFQRQ